MKFIKVPFAIALGAVAAFSSGHVMSQTLALEEIVVTARKQVELLQDVPVAVSVVGKKVIDMAFLGDSTAIAQFSPNLVFDHIDAGSPAAANISLRGISFQDVEKSFDPSVLIHVDGIPLGTNTGNVMNLLDLESIEVLRGPQGTLFGKNAVGGVININRVKPNTEEVAGKARVRFGNYGRQDFEGVLNIPLGDTFAAKLNVAQLENDGYWRNVTRGDKEGDQKEKRFGIHLLWRPIDSVVLEFQYNDSDLSGTAGPQLATDVVGSTVCDAFGQCAPSLDKPLSGSRDKGAGLQVQPFSMDLKDYQFNAVWDITDEWAFVAIYGNRTIDDSQRLDFDGTPLPIFDTLRKSKYEQDSLELRASFHGEKVSGTLGYFYWKSDLDFTQETEIPLLLGLPGDACGNNPGMVRCQMQVSDYGTESNSFFFEGDYRFTDKWIGTLGARYITEDKAIGNEILVPIFDLISLPYNHYSRTDSDTIYRASLRYEADNYMAYGTYSTGFRSGGFSIRAATPEVLGAGYDPEKVKNIELGLKTTLLDGRLRLNAAIFDMTYDDIQIEVNIPGGATGQQDAVLNAAKATIRGAELEATWLMAESWTADLNVGWLDAKYDNFIGRVFGDQPFSADNSNLPMRRAPDWNYTAALNYSNQVGPGNLSARLSWHWTDDYAATVTDFPGTHIDSYGVLDLGLSYRIGSWQFSAYGRNLNESDEYTHTLVVTPFTTGEYFFSFANPRIPRTYGVEVTYFLGNL